MKWLLQSNLFISSLHLVTLLIVVIKAPEIYSLSKSPVFNTILLMIVITVYIKSLDLFILYNCYFVPFGHLCVSPTSQLLVTFILFSIYSTILHFILSEVMSFFSCLTYYKILKYIQKKLPLSWLPFPLTFLTVII